MLSYPFTFVGILIHTFFFLMLPFFFIDVTIVFDFITHRFVVAHTTRSIHQGPYTQATFEGSNVYTPVYFYIEKN